MNEIKRRDFIIGAVFALFSFCLGFLVLDSSYNNWGGDFSQYIAQARAIIAGETEKYYIDNSFIIENSPAGLGPVLYPWGFPLLLAFSSKFFGTTWICFKLIGVITFSLFVLILFLWMRVRFNYKTSIIVVLLFACNPTFIVFFNHILSDIPYMLFSLLSIWAIEWFMSAKEKKVSFVSGVVCGLSMVVAYEIRSNGIILIITLLVTQFIFHLYYIIKKMPFCRSMHIEVIPYVIFAVNILLINTYLPSADTSYFNYIHMISKKQIANFLKLYIELPKEFLPDILGMHILYFIFVLFFIYGFVKYIWKEKVAGFYLLGTFLLLIIYPYYQGMRFIYSCLPMLVLFTTYGIHDFAQKVDRGGAV